jgi:uncharacterized protein (TIGR03437 family)
MRKWVLFSLIATTCVAASDHVVLQYLDFGDSGRAELLAADGTGNLFAVGLVTEPSGLPQIRVIKADSTGNPLAVFDFGGSQQDTVSGVAADADGNIVIVGSTQSPDFPLTTPSLFQTKLPAGFVVKIDPQLQHIVFSNLLGGVNGQFASATAVAVDSGGNIYASGATNETDFPVTPNALQSTVPADPFNQSKYGFVMEISKQGQLVFSTYYTGTKPTFCLPPLTCAFARGTTVPASIAVDSGGNIVVAGYTTTSDLPITAGAYSQQCNCGQSGFIAKFAPGGSKLVWATLLPPNDGTLSTIAIAGIALESDGTVVAAGTVAGGLPTTAGALQPAPASATASSGFVSRIDATGEHVVFSTYLGGAVIAPSVSGVNAVATDAKGQIWITGSSTPPAFSGLPSLGSTYTVSLSMDGAKLTSGFTAPETASGQAIVVSTQGAIASLGSSGSLLLGGATQTPSLIGVANSAATRVSGIAVPLELISLYGIGIGPATPMNAQISATGPAAQFAVSKTLGGFQVLFNGIAAPLLYAGPTQINAVVPAGVADADTATVQVVTPTGAIAGPSLRVRPSQPQVFGAAAPVGYVAFALNQDGTANSPANPAAYGSIVTVWATGAGLFNPSFADGTIVSSVATSLVSYRQLAIPLPISVLSYASPAALPSELESVQVLYAGAAPGDVEGVIQVNFALAGGNQPKFQLQIGSVLSDSFYIYQKGISVGQ